MSVADVVAETAGKFGGNPAIIYRESLITFARIQETAARFGNALAGLGIGKGARERLR